MSTSKWTSVITNAGKNLLSYISEQHLVITKAECGDTRTEGSLEELTGIQNPKDMVLYPSQSIESNLQFRITLSNQNILTGFSLYQIGIYAKLENQEDDVLFMVIQAAENQPDIIPSNQESPNYVNDYVVRLIVANTNQITVQVTADKKTLYVTARIAGIYSMPSDSSAELMAAALGDQVEQTAICDNGWSKVEAESEGEKVIGYMQTQALNSENQILSVDEEEVEVTSDSSILDYPGKKDGEVVGEVLELDQVKRTGTVNGVWSRIKYQNADGTEKEGYIPTSCLDVADAQESTDTSASIDKKKDAGTLHKSSGKGVFADALETDESVTEQNGVQIGTPVAASSDAKLKDLGVFKITHYCPCSICCGPYANGITSTGVTAVTNHTIAVDPSQIPYGSKVVINGQVYVAEDCGGAIKTNCIDIYVATHAEGESKGVYYTEVYLIQ